MATAPHLVADDRPDPFAQLRGLISQVQADVETAKGDPSRSTIGKLDADVRELSVASQRVEDQRAQDPAMRLANVVAEAVAQAIAASSTTRGQPPIGRGGIYGIVVMVCMALVGSPVLGSVLTSEETASQIAALNKRDQELEDKVNTVSQWKEGIDRRLASEQRINAWLVEVAQVQTTALAEIAKALNVEVDLKMPVLWPE